MNRQALHRVTGDTSRKHSMLSSTGDLSRGITGNAVGPGSLHEDCDRHAPCLPLVFLAMLSGHSRRWDKYLLCTRAHFIDIWMTDRLSTLLVTAQLVGDLQHRVKC